MCIMDHLPPHSAVSFFLSCWHLKDLLGPEKFSKFTSSTDHKLELLDLLAIDLPNSIVCIPCKRLHKMENMQRYNMQTQSSLRALACVAKDFRDNFDDISQLFGTTAFKMAVKRHHQQPECTELLSLMSSERAQTAQSGDYVRQSQEECRVIQGHLMHRLQSVRVSRRSLNGTTFTDDLCPEMICPHIKLRNSTQESKSGIRRCRKCCTEYSIDYTYFDGHGMAMFFTRWKDLGTGPESGVWKQHLRGDELADLWEGFFRYEAQTHNETAMEGHTEVESQPQAGEIASAFGDGDGPEFDSWLTSGNKSELLVLQQQCVFRQR